MAGRRRRRQNTTATSSTRCGSGTSSLSIGNCKVEILGSGVSYESSPSNILFSVSDYAKIKISVEGKRDSLYGDYSFLLLNPKDIDSRSRALLQDVLRLYMKELPTMNYAANTGKESLFLERCVSSGKYRTLVMKTNDGKGSTEVIAAVSYQIVPADTQFAEIPVAAVSENYQHKGIGRFLYMELRLRLQSVGVLTLFCWGDKESEGFWVKQGFVSIAEVDSKGKARKLPIKADIRRALCFPGCSTLMVSHLNKDLPVLMCPPVNVNTPRLEKTNENYVGMMSCKEGALNLVTRQTESSQPKALQNNRSTGKEQNVDDLFSNPYEQKGSDDLSTLNGMDNSTGCHDLVVGKNGYDSDKEQCTCSRQGNKRRIWQSSLSSMKSKKVKGGHHVGCRLDSDLLDKNDGGYLDSCDNFSLRSGGDKTLLDATSADLPYHDDYHVNNVGRSGIDLNWNPLFKIDDLPNHYCRVDNAGKTIISHATTTNMLVDKETCLQGRQYSIMLMDIADVNKKIWLTKIIEDLGGVVTSSGSSCTHVVTMKARRTLNFCTALSRGVWIVSPSWLKESSREGKFVGELPFILKDEDYFLRYRSELKDAVLRAKEHPCSLLKGYEVCLSKHVQPPLRTLADIVKSSGGSVLNQLHKVQEPSRTILLACEEDMEEALVAAKRGVWTYSSEWFMSCVMRQVLDFEAPQFAESL